MIFRRTWHGAFRTPMLRCGVFRYRVCRSSLILKIFPRTFFFRSDVLTLSRNSSRESSSGSPMRNHETMAFGVAFGFSSTFALALPLALPFALPLALPWLCLWLCLQPKNLLLKVQELVLNLLQLVPRVHGLCARHLCVFITINKYK